MTLANDRRRKRSLDPLVALHYQLAQSRAESQLDAIVVADGSGIVVAGAGAWAVCEELAAYAPLLAQDGSNAAPGGGSRVAELSGEVDVQSLEVDGQTVLLCARGGSAGAATRRSAGSERAAAMTRAAEGVARILRSAA